jgi:hypothetical protein
MNVNLQVFGCVSEPRRPFYFDVIVLQVNSVGVYQLSKLMSIPVIAVMQWLIHRKTLELQTVIVRAPHRTNCRTVLPFIHTCWWP